VKVRATRGRSKKRLLAWIGAALVVVLLVVMSGGLWFASGQLLSPTFHGVSKDLAVCAPETEKYFGKDCGNLRENRAFTFGEVKIRSVNGYDLPGWLVRTADNAQRPARGAILLVHAGGSDRREDTRYIKFYLSQQLDVLTFDLSCQGEAPCPTSGITYGSRESRDVLSAYTYLTAKRDTVYAMGSSVGASAILIALPKMPKLKGVIAENAMANFRRLITEAPEARSMPEFFSNLLVKLVTLRGHFDPSLSPEHSLAFAGKTPILFIHSKADKVVSYQQTKDLVTVYPGPKAAWYPAKGEHAAVWDANRAEYEQRVGAFLNGTLQ
jgi:uncharacterized protein